MEYTSKEIKVIKAIRNKENEMWQKAIWCNGHDLPLEEQKFRYAESILRKLATDMQEILETVYVKGDNEQAL